MFSIGDMVAPRYKAHSDVHGIMGVVTYKETNAYGRVYKVLFTSGNQVIFSENNLILSFSKPKSKIKSRPWK